MSKYPKKKYCEGSGRAKTSGGPVILSGPVGALLVLLCSTGRVDALPEGGRVVAGQASWSVTNKTLSVTAGDRSILHFSKFNIASDEHVNFVQPSASSRVLARATDGTPSEIFGKLTSNGRLVLANEAGIHFREGSAISVGGLIAAAGRVSDSDFLRGDASLGIELTGTVSNHGLIESGAHVVLAGLTVENAGSIVAPSGTVVLHAGAAVLAVEQDSDIYVVDTGDFRDAGGAASVTGFPGEASAPERRGETSLASAASSAARQTAAAKTGVIQNGKISARAVSLGAGDIYSVGVRHAGRTASRRVSVVTPSKVEVSGEIDASGGGSVGIRGGAQVELVGSRIMATGDQGGGSIDVGGKSVSVDAGSVLDASGVGRGSGGRVGIAGDSVLVDGKVIAVGGSDGGNGGIIGVYARSGLEMGAVFQTDVSAPRGAAGALHIDDPKLRPILEEGGFPVPGSGYQPSGAGVGEIRVRDGVLSLENQGGELPFQGGLLLSAGAVIRRTDPVNSVEREAPRTEARETGLPEGLSLSGDAVLGIGYIAVPEADEAAAVSPGILQLGRGVLTLAGEPREVLSQTSTAEVPLYNVRPGDSAGWAGQVNQAILLNGGEVRVNREELARMYRSEDMRLSLQAVRSVMPDATPEVGERPQRIDVRNPARETVQSLFNPTEMRSAVNTDPARFEYAISPLRGQSTAADVLGVEIFRRFQQAPRSGDWGTNARNSSDSPDVEAR